MSNAPAESSQKAKVGLFDIRNIVGALLFLYGVILVLASFGTSDAQKAKAHGVNANLWVGLALLVVGALMIVWAVTRPIVVDKEQLEADKRAIDEAARGRRDESGSVD
jgi:uncharacterized membrane protein